MQWIKASERLPEKEGMYVCKVRIIEDGLTFLPVAYTQYNERAKYWTSPSVCYKSGEVVEWLDESSPSSPVPASIEEAARAFIRDNPSGYNDPALNDAMDEGKLKGYLAGSRSLVKEGDGEYWKQRCKQAESVIQMMDTPKNKSNTDNHQFLTWRDRYAEWIRIVGSPVSSLPSSFIERLRGANPYHVAYERGITSKNLPYRVWIECCDKAEELIKKESK